MSRTQPSRPNGLRDYIENFRAILEKYETEAGFYAHASVGLLHIRPVVNMKSALGVQRFEAIAAEVADLVLEYGGALSGEHGDGLVRAPFQERMFGPALYDAFCQVKAAFDPTNLLNPGKIVHAPALTANLRFGPDYETPEHATAFDFSDFGGLLRATEQCSGVGACRKTLTGTMCPSYMATRNEIDSTRGRANALRMALAGGLEATGFDDEELLPVLNLCLECKACKRECPTGVDMAPPEERVPAPAPCAPRRALQRPSVSPHRPHRALGQPVRAAVELAVWRRCSPAGSINHSLGSTDAVPCPPSPPAPFPAAGATAAGPHAATPVALFADTFNNYFEPLHLESAARVLERCGAAVTVAPEVCCGRPLISKGFLDAAARQAKAVTTALLPLARAGTPILFCEPSCYSAVQDDHPRLLRAAEQADAQEVADACQLFEEVGRPPHAGDKGRTQARSGPWPLPPEGSRRHAAIAAAPWRHPQL